MQQIFQTISLIVAEKFEKRHANVLRDIRNLDCTTIFHGSNFALVEIIGKNALGGPVNRSYFSITRGGLMFLVMGYTGVTRIANHYVEHPIRVHLAWNLQYLVATPLPTRLNTCV